MLVFIIIILWVRRVRNGDIVKIRNSFIYVQKGTSGRIRKILLDEPTDGETQC